MSDQIKSWSFHALAAQSDSNKKSKNICVFYIKTVPYIAD